MSTVEAESPPGQQSGPEENPEATQQAVSTEVNDTALAAARLLSPAVTIVTSAPGPARTWWRAEPGVIDWVSFVRWLKAGVTSGGKYGRPYVPATFTGTPTRRMNTTIAERHLITLDADHADADYLARVAKAVPYAHLSHTTASHTLDEPRWRTIIPVSRPMTPVEAKSIAAWLLDRIGRDAFDVQASTSPVAVAYAPAWPGVEYSQHGGPTLDVDEVMLIAPELEWTIGDPAGAPTVDEWMADHEPTDLAELPTCGYGRTALDQTIGKLEGTEEGHGVHNAIYAAAARFVELVSAGCWSVRDAERLAEASVALRAYPRPHEWDEALASALRRGIPARSACAQHGPTEPDLSSSPGALTFTPGGSFILDTDPDPVPLWGQGTEVLWAKGEALIIAAPQGLGKTTLAQQLTLARLGLTDGLLGHPVLPTTGRVLYLAMDRPKQAARSMRRMVTEDMREVLDDRLSFWEGPPVADMAKSTTLLTEMCQSVGADTVVVDSLKDAAVGLADEAVGGGWNRSRQTALAAGIEVLELHHNRKQGQHKDAKDAPSVDAIFGSVWITSGTGSILLLEGKGGDPIVTAHHVKQPAETVGPFRIIHDHVAGRSTVYHAADLVLLARTTPGGITVNDAAGALFETDSPSDNDRAKARRRLTTLTSKGLLQVTAEGQRGGGKDRAQTRWEAL